MKQRRKNWREKLATDNGLPKTVALDAPMRARFGAARGATMMVPAPRQVDAVMKKVRRGKVITINGIRAALAQQHKVDMCCPMTAGIFAWIAAHAAAEAMAEGKKRVTPWWRTVKAGGELNPKYPGGTQAQAKLLRAEGRTVVKRGKRWFVDGVE